MSHGCPSVRRLSLRGCASERCVGIVLCICLDPGPGCVLATDLIDLLLGTPFLVWYFRALGAKVRRTGIPWQ